MTKELSCFIIFCLMKFLTLGIVSKTTSGENSVIILQLMQRVSFYKCLWAPIFTNSNLLNIRHIVILFHRKTALERHNLQKMGITHIVNAAEGKWNNVATGPDYYNGMNIYYYGVEAEDIPAFNLAVFLPGSSIYWPCTQQPRGWVKRQTDYNIYSIFR